MIPRRNSHDTRSCILITQGKKGTLDGEQPSNPATPTHDYGRWTRHVFKYQRVLRQDGCQYARIDSQQALMPSKTSPPPPVEPATFHVAIVGGGIGGLTCALSLAQHCPGLQISVFEQAPAYKEIGAGIGIGVNAAKILHKLGVGKAANAISGKRNGMHRSMRRWDNGAEIVTVEAMDEPGETRQLSVHRAEFLEVLYQAIKERGIARLFTNKKAIKVEVCPMYHS
jgi:hypothetical protein